MRTHGFRHHFTIDAVVTEVIGVLRSTAEQQGFLVWAYCFMPDHLHLLVEGQSSHADMRQFVRLFKQRSAYWFKGVRGAQLWAANYYEHVLRNDEATAAVARYIIQNPVRKGTVDDFSSYPYSGSFELESIEDL